MPCWYSVFSRLALSHGDTVPLDSSTMLRFWDFYPKHDNTFLLILGNDRLASTSLLVLHVDNSDAGVAPIRDCISIFTSEIDWIRRISISAQCDLHWLAAYVHTAGTDSNLCYLFVDRSSTIVETCRITIHIVADIEYGEHRLGTSTEKVSSNAGAVRFTDGRWWQCVHKYLEREIYFYRCDVICYDFMFTEKAQKY